MTSKIKPSNHQRNINFLESEIKNIKNLDLQNTTIEFFASSQCNDLYLVSSKEKKFLAKITNWEQNKLWKTS